MVQFKPIISTHVHLEGAWLDSVSVHAGVRDAVPTRVSVFLCAAFGPLGLLSDALTRIMFRRGATSAGHEQLTLSTQA